MTGSSITVETVSVDGSTVECEVSATGTLRRFLTGDPFRVEYDVDVSGVPESILTIPVLAHVAPVAWTDRGTVHVDEIDRTYLSSLYTVRNALKNMYPEFVLGGDVAAGTLRETPPPDAGATGTGVRTETDGGVGADGEAETGPRVGAGTGTAAGGGPGSGGADAGLLFSGGVDSVASYVRHREEPLRLLSVHGWVIGADDQRRWDRTNRFLEGFADEQGVNHGAIRSNMLDALDTPMLHAHFKPYMEGSWYSGVGHGVGLLSLCAPLAYARGLDTLYIAATHTREFTEPWGSHPTIDNNVAWSGTTCEHDGYELSRQGKIERIESFVRTEAPDLTLRTCTADAGDRANCAACEKCYRTAIGLMLAGLDPTDHGYDLDDDAFERIREGFENGEWILGEDERFMWEDLQRHVADATPPSPEAAEFYEWLESADFDEYVGRATPPLSHRALRAVARNVPNAAYTSLYPVYERLKR